jgi:hypothetical protein
VGTAGEAEATSEIEKNEEEESLRLRAASEEAAGGLPWLRRLAGGKDGDGCGGSPSSLHGPFPESLFAHGLFSSPFKVTNLKFSIKI